METPTESNLREDDHVQWKSKPMKSEKTHDPNTATNTDIVPACCMRDGEFRF